MKKEEKEYEHPSFGMLSISRIHGQSGYLFGTEIQADNFIELTLSGSEYETRFNSGLVSSRQNIIPS